MTIGLRLRLGSRYLNLNAGRYGVTPSFVPPDTKFSTQVTRGTALNKRGGSLVSTRAENREWKVTLNVFADGHAEVDAAAAEVQRWLNEAGDTRVPLTIEWRLDDSLPEPVWGQFNAWRAYEIVHGGVTLMQSGEFNYAQLSGIGLTLEIKPYALGKAQMLATAKGGMFEDKVGASDGRSRGVMVARAVTNKLLNPVFGHATWFNSWLVTSTNLTEQNTDERFKLFGSNSLRVVRLAADSCSIYQSVNVGNTNTHTLWFYAKKRDGSAVTASDVRVYYNAMYAPTLTALGDGWYRGEYAVTGINAATNAGISVNAQGVELFIAGMCLAETTIPGPMCWGDALGHSWSGTAHASTSSRTAGMLRLPTVGRLNVAGGSLRVIATMPYASTTASDFYLFSTGATKLRAYFNATDDKFYFTDGTNTISSAAQTFSEGAVSVFDFVWGPGQLAMYKDGATLASGTAFTIAAAGTYVYLGSDDTPANQLNARVVEVALFDAPLTAAQVAANYALLSPLLADGQRPATVPWLWTKDGDDTLDNCLDTSGSTGAPHTNYGVVGGVPGSAPAATVFRFEKVAGTQVGEVWISHVPTDEFLNPVDWLYMELSGSADALSSGGAYQDTAALSTTGVEIAAKNLTEAYYRELAKRSFYLFGVFLNDGVGTANLQIGGLLTGMTTPDYQTYQKNIGTSVGITKSLKIADAIAMATGVTITVSLYAKRSTGSATLSTDFVMIMPEPVVRISNTASPSDLVLDSERGAFFGYTYQVPCVRQAPIELQPEQANLLLAIIQNNTIGYKTAHTLKANSVTVTPRWELV